MGIGRVDDQHRSLKNSPGRLRHARGNLAGALLRDLHALCKTGATADSSLASRAHLDRYSSAIILLIGAFIVGNSSILFVRLSKKRFSGCTWGRDGIGILALASVGAKESK